MKMKILVTIPIATIATLLLTITNLPLDEDSTSLPSTPTASKTAQTIDSRDSAIANVSKPSVSKSEEQDSSTLGKTNSDDFQTQLSDILSQGENDSDSARFAIMDVLSKWGAKDIEATLAWLNANSDIFGIQDYYRVAFLGAIHDSEQDVSRLILDLPSDLVVKSDIIYDYVQVIRKGNISEGLEWAAQIPEQHLKDNSQNLLYIEWSENAPLDVLNHIASYPDLDEQMLQQAVEVGMAAYLRDKDLVSKEFIYQYPKGVQGFMARTTISHMMYFSDNPDIEKAHEWVQSLPAGNLKDQSINHYIKLATGHISVKDAFEMTDTIVDGSTRQKVIKDSFQQWYAEEPAIATEALMANSEFNEEQKNEMLERVKQNELPREG